MVHAHLLHKLLPLEVYDSVIDDVVVPPPDEVSNRALLVRHDAFLVLKCNIIFDFIFSRIENCGLNSNAVSQISGQSQVNELRNLIIFVQ